MERALEGSAETPNVVAGKAQKTDIWDEFRAEFAKGTPSESADETVESGTTEEVVETAAPEVEEPEGTVETPSEDSGFEAELDAVATKGLEGVPEQYRELVRKTLEKTEKSFKASFTKKTQELSQLKKQYDVVEPLTKLGIPLSDIPKHLDNFQKLVDFLKREDVKITQGDEVITGFGGKVEEPDLDSMTPAQQAQWYKSQLAKVNEEAQASVRREVAPLKKAADMANLKSRYDTWRASRKDVGDDVLALARGHALAYENKLGKLFGAEFFNDLDASMEPFIAQARIDLSTSKKAASKRTATASTELPNSGLKPTSYKGTDLAKAWDSVKKDMGIS